MMILENFSFWVAIAVAVIAVIVIAKTAVVVPQQSAFVVESLGKYSRTIRAGFHILIPFIEKSAYKLSLKELALDIHGRFSVTGCQTLTDCKRDAYPVNICIFFIYF